MRLVLVSLIALAQVAGPWLCCCAFARLSSALSGRDGQHGTPTPVPAKTPTCPHCAKAEPATQTGPTEPPPPPLPDKCPCGGYELVAVPAERNPVADEDLILVAEPFALPASYLTVPSPVAAVWPGLRELPWLTVADRLFGHHVLRC